MHSSLFEAATTDAKILEAHQYVGYEFVTGDEPSEAGPKQKKRRKPKGIIWQIDADGNWLVLDPRDSIWWKLYISRVYRLSCPNSGPAGVPEDPDKFNKLFRRRFRMPYDRFLKLIDICKGSDYFQKWKDGKADALGKESSPIELLLLASLRYLGRDGHLMIFQK